MNYKILITVIFTTLMTVGSNAQSIVGSWLFGNAGQANSSGVITFLSNGIYFMAEDGDSIADPSGQDGMERGSYTWNSSTGAFSATTLLDTSGEWGLSHPIGITNIAVTGDSLSYNDGGGSVTLMRISGTQLAPEPAEVAAKLPGQIVNNTQFTSTTRFVYQEGGGNPEHGNWSYTKVSANLGLLTQTYDEDGNDPSVWREETWLTFLTKTTGTYVYREFDQGVLSFEGSGNFDFPWLADTSSVSISASSAGAGTITPSGSLMVDAGADQTFTATPNAGYVVDVWRMNGNVTQSGGTTYTVYNAQSSVSVEVSFKLRQIADDVVIAPVSDATPPVVAPANPVSDKTSKYSGFLTDGAGTVGYFSSIKVSKTGALSAKMIIGDETFTIKGQFDENGVFTSDVTAKSDKFAKINFLLGITASGGKKITGTVKIGDINAKVSAVQAGSTTQQAGNYTVLIPNEDDEPGAPQGQGYGLMNVKTTGTAKIKGLLGDGGKWTAKCFVTPDGEMLLFAKLYRKSGSLAGLIRFRDTPSVSDCDGSVNWVKPFGTGVSPYLAGFNLQRKLIGSRIVFTGQRLLTGLQNDQLNAEVHIGPGSGEPLVSYDVDWTEKNKLIYTGPLKVKVKASKKGLIKGSVKDERSKWKVEGVVFQKQNLGAGLVYVKGGEPRRLTIVPRESNEPN